MPLPIHANTRNSIDPQLPSDGGQRGSPVVRLLGRVLRLPRRAMQAARKRKRWVFLLAFLLVTSAAVGMWQYAVHQWRASEIALKEDRLEEAQKRLAVCLWVWPRSPEVHLRAARVSRLAGDFQAAEAHLTRCLELQSGANDGVQLEFLLMRVQAGEVDEERGRGPISTLFEAVQNGHPDSSAILETIARAYLLRLRYKPAFGCLNLWIEIEPRNPKPYYLRGWTMERINNPKAAKVDYDRALELDPEMILARLRVAEMLLLDKQAPEALRHLERLRRQSPNDVRVQSRLGMCLFLQGRGEEARRLMENAVVELPHDSALLICLASLDLQEGRGADAERRLRVVLADDPADTEALFVLASALQLQGRAEESAAALAEHAKKKVIVDRINLLLKEVADSPTAGANDYAEIGQFFFQIARDKLALYWLERALEQEPSNQRAHHVLAEHYEQKGDATRAAAHRRQIRPEAPTPPPPNPAGRGNEPPHRTLSNARHAQIRRCDRSRDCGRARVFVELRPGDRTGSGG